MENHPLTYVEKLQNLHVLMETRAMLNEQLKKEQTNPLIEEDLQKIEEEIMAYTNGKQIQMNELLVQSLFNPAVLYELDEQ